jgi:cyclic lactone autoinducer peptide
MKKFVSKFGGRIARAALGMTTLSVNTACFIWWHQPKLPEGAKKLRKF